MAILRNVAFGLMLVLALAGCAMPNGYYQPAAVADGVISNPRVGWNGYSVKVPDGLKVFNPATADPDSPELTKLQRWLLKEEDRYSRAISVVYTEKFLMENPDGRGFIFFTSDTLEMGSPWSTMLSQKKDHYLRKMINSKMVMINDTEAHNELITINGNRGYYISGIDRPYSKKKNTSYAYEGYLIIGNLKETFWVEGFSPFDQREYLQQKTREVVESLQIK